MMNQNESADASSSVIARKLFLHSISMVIILTVAIFAIGAWIGLAWFVSNDRVSAGGITISAKSQPVFRLATVGNKEQGVYDNMFGLLDSKSTERYGDVDYYIAEGNSSFRVSTDRNLNNYLANADLRPGNRGSFDLYVICQSSSRSVTIQPVLSAWYEHKVTGTEQVKYKDAFAPEDPDAPHAAANYLKGHLLMFANMDDKGMYSGYLDMTRPFTVTLADKQSQVTQDERSFSWNTKEVYADETTTIYLLPLHWVWPEQFGNFIYTGNAYAKNLFFEKNADYNALCGMMNTDCRRFFNSDTPLNVGSITSSSDYQAATRIYEEYSRYYDQADEAIGTLIAYVELGFSTSPEENRGSAE